MKRSVFWAVSAFLAAATSFADSMTYYVLELRGGSKIYAADKPVPRGRVLVFHRYPDGVFLSLQGSEVEKITTLEAPPPPAEKLAPGASMYVGPALEGPGYEAPPAPPSSGPYVDPYAYGYGYSDDYWGGGYVPNPRPPGPRVPSRIGPNGYPILAPPGSPGSVPPPIGPNGYPILAPPPASIQPRRR